MVSSQGGRYCRLIVSSVGNSFRFFSGFCLPFCTKFYGIPRVNGLIRNIGGNVECSAGGRRYQGGRCIGTLELTVVRVPGSPSGRWDVLVNGTCVFFISYS